MELADGSGDLDTAGELISAGADVNAKGENGATALMWAAENRHALLVRAVIAAGANVNAKSASGESVLQFVDELGTTGAERHAVAEILVAAGAKR